MLSKRRPGRSEQVEHTVQIDGFPDVQLVLRPYHIIEQKFQHQGAAEAPSLDLEVGKSHRKEGPPDVLHADETGVLHRLRETVALPRARGSADMVGAVLAEIFAADILVAALPVPASDPAALVAEKLHLVLLGLRQAVQLFKGLVQSEIRHHIAKFLPGRLVPELSEIRQHLGCGGDEVKLRVVRPQVVQQQLRMEDDAILHPAALCKEGAERIAFPVRKMFLPEEGVAEGQPGRDAILEYGISARLTFSNSLLREEHLSNRKCNALCALFAQSGGVENGVILHSELLLDYLRTHYPQLYLVSSTTKVLTDFRQLRDETAREEFRYVVPDFRLNKAFEQLDSLTQPQKDKVEFLCNECCWVGCRDRKRCYENVSRKNLGEDCPDHICTAPGAGEGYRFSKAMENPSFIGVEDIRRTFLPMGFSNFKIEGRGLGSALVLEFLLYYMVRPEYQLHVREAIYLDSMLDLF